MADEVRLIDADALKVILNKVEEESERDWFKGNEFREMIDITPTIEAQPDNGWISVDDRLPDDKERYLICTEDGRIDIAYYQPIGDKFSDYEPFWQGSCRFTTSVTYWQHLPEPPKEVENETN